LPNRPLIFGFPGKFPETLGNPAPPQIFQRKSPKISPRGTPKEGKRKIGTPKTGFGSQSPKTFNENPQGKNPKWFFQLREEDFLKRENKFTWKPGGQPGMEPLNVESCFKELPLEMVPLNGFRF